MLIHPWDAAISDTEWRNWLAGHDFGQLVVSDPGNGAPHVIPTHFAVDGDTLLVHLPRPNKVWAAIQARPTVVMSVIDDYAYIPTTWRAKAGGPDEDGVPTSYYSAVQLTCRAEIVDDPQDKAELLRRQLAHFQPQGDHAQVAADMPPTAGCSQESAACACTSPVWPPSSNTTTTTRKNTGPRSPNASKAAEPDGTAPQPPPSNAGVSTKSANGNPAANQISSSGNAG